MKTADIEWARAAVRAMLVRVIGVCAAELRATGLGALHAAKECRRFTK